MTETVKLNVTGMKCGGCENNVKEKLSALVGVSSVTADHKANTVEVTYDEAVVDLAAIKQGIVDAGYGVED